MGILAIEMFKVIKDTLLPILNELFNHNEENNYNFRNSSYFTNSENSLLKWKFYHITVSAWVLIPPSKPQLRNFFCPPGTENLYKTPQADKKP